MHGFHFLNYDIIFQGICPDCRLVIPKETMTVEGMIKIVGVNAATEEYEVKGSVDRYPLCGIALDENGVCPKCGYRK